MLGPVLLLGMRTGEANSGKRLWSRMRSHRACGHETRTSKLHACGHETRTSKLWFQHAYGRDNEN